MVRLADKLPVLIAKNNPFELLFSPVKKAWSISNMRLFQRCKRKFFWKDLWGLSSKVTESFFIIGSAYHEGLAKWYKSHGKNMKLIARALKVKYTKTALQDIDLRDPEDAEDLIAQISSLEGMLIGYSEVYPDDLVDFVIDPTNIEKWFSVDCEDFIFKGKVDFIGRQKKNIVVMEHKTASKFNEAYIDTLPVDTEARGFLYGIKYGLGLNPGKVIYSIVKKTKLRGKSNESHTALCKRISNDYMLRPDFYFHREVLRYSMSDLATFEQDLFRTHEEYRWFMQSPKARTDPCLWPTSDGECRTFGSTCPFLTLCVEGLDRSTAKLYRQYIPKLGAHS